MSNFITMMRKTLRAYDNIETHNRLRQLEDDVRAQLSPYNIPDDVLKFTTNVSTGEITSICYLWASEAKEYFTYDDLLDHPAASISGTRRISIHISSEHRLDEVKLRTSFYAELPLPEQEYNFLASIGKITMHYEPPREVLACGAST